MDEMCVSYCEHGGRCDTWLDDGKPHEGLHDSGYCQWSDAEALTREAADAVLRTKPLGRAYLDNLGGLTEEEATEEGLI